MSPVWETKPIMIVLVIVLMLVAGAWIQPSRAAKREPRPRDGMAGTCRMARMTRSRTGRRAQPEI